MKGSPFRCIIIDNDVNSIEFTMETLAEVCPFLKVLEIVNSESEIRQTINKLLPDLVILNVSHGQPFGFEGLANTKHRDFKVICISRDAESAVKAFQFGAVYYLQQPFTQGEFATAVARYLNINKLENIAKAYHSGQKELPEKLILNVYKGKMIVAIRDIISLELDSNKTVFHLKNDEKITIAKPISYYENMLSSYNFFRIHTRYLINMQMIKRYITGRGGIVTMIDGSQMEVAAARKSEFLHHLQDTAIK